MTNHEKEYLKSKGQKKQQITGANTRRKASLTPPFTPLDFFNRGLLGINAFSRWVAASLDFLITRSAKENALIV